MIFRDPEYLTLLVFLPLWGLWRYRGERNSPALHLGHAGQYDCLPDTFRARCARILPLLQALIVLLAITALARPQVVERETRVEHQAVDLMLLLDLSTSMLVQEIGTPSHHNRLDVAKEAVARFVERRPNDRFGLVAFAARPYPAVPLTMDHPWFLAAVGRLDTGAIEDGTAIGDALMAGVNHLRDASGKNAAKSAALILITDGRNNAGATPPPVAAAVARQLGVRVHTIGIGSHASGMIPMENPLGGILYRRIDADLDEAGLQVIAASTGGRYFRADDPEFLSIAMTEIDRLEKRPSEARIYFVHRELYSSFLLAALILSLTELVLSASWLRRIP